MIAGIWFLAALGAASLTAQTITTSEITGTVVDPSGAVVTTATVLLKNVDTGDSRSAPSDSAGIYRFTFVKPGTYEISGSSAGLKSDTGRLIAAVGQVQVLPLTLKLEEPKEVVLVTDAAPLLNTDNANTAYTVSTRQLELLPLPGGDLVGVAYSIPGVIINNGFGNGNFASLGVGSTSNLFTVNGVDNMDPYYNVNNSGTSGLMLGANEIREASIVQNAYEGQYGRQAGTQMNYVSKSGTNSYHGNLVYSYGGAVLNANDFFNNATGSPRPGAVSNQYAASFGGRVIRDKLFFFADTEGLRIAGSGSATVVAIPSAALQSYSLRTIQPSQVPIYQRMFDLYNNAPGHERAVPVTNGAGPLQDSRGKLGCGSLAGTPTGTGGVFGVDVSCAQAWGTNISSPTSEWLLSTRVDYNLSSKQRLFFRFKTDHGFLPWQTSAINPVFNIVETQPDYEGQLNHTYVITPRLVNNFIGSANYSDYVQAFADLSAALKLLPFRMNVYELRANASACNRACLGPPAQYPQGRRDGQLQIIDDISYNAGRHALKAGVNYRYNREADLQYSAYSSIGAYQFRFLNEFASGAINPSSGSVYEQAFPATPVLHLRLYNLGAYVQDQWAITAHLKITATVRFDRTGNPHCLDHCFAQMISPFPELTKGLTIPYDQSIQTGLAHAFYQVEPVVAQPRLSLVYNPGWSKSSVFRGGIGLFTDLYAAQFAGIMAGNTPNVFTALVRTGLVDTGGPGSSPAIAAASASAFESQFANGATLEQLQRAVAPAPFFAPGYSSIPSTLRSPRYLEWSFEIQQQLGAKNVFTARYAGNHGYNIFVTNPNANASADPAVYPKGFAGLPFATPDPRFQIVQQLTNTGFSNYDGLIVTFRRAFGHGFQGQFGYTWSHALDTVSNGGLTTFNYFTSLSGQINPYDLRSLNYGAADYDVRHQLTADFIWDIPVKFKDRLMGAIFTSWSVASRLNAHTGFPFSVRNSSVDGLSSSFGGTVLADVVDPNIRTSCGRSAIDTPCFTSGQFATTQADFGNRPRNSFRGPGFFDLDSSLYKTVPFGDRMRLTVGASAYNLLNHPNFLAPDADVAYSGLGLIQGTARNPSSPYGLYGGPSGRAIVITGRFAF